MQVSLGEILLAQAACLQINWDIGSPIWFWVLYQLIYRNPWYIKFGTGNSRVLLRNNASTSRPMLNQVEIPVYSIRDNFLRHVLVHYSAINRVLLDYTGLGLECDCASFFAAPLFLMRTSGSQITHPWCQTTSLFQQNDKSSSMRTHFLKIKSIIARSRKAALFISRCRFYVFYLYNSYVLRKRIPNHAYFSWIQHINS